MVDRALRAEKPRLLAFLRRRIRDPEEAEDVLQDVFYELLVHYNFAEPIERLTSWLFTVAKNKITDWYRKRRPVPLAGADGDSPASLEDLLFDPKDQPPKAFLRSLVWDELAEALSELPAAQRDVFVKTELEGKSFKEVAEASGEPVSTLLARKRYAVLFLRGRLREIYEAIQSL